MATAKKKDRAAAAQKVEKRRCVCGSAAHGHRPGKCVSTASKSDGLCDFCHNRAAEEAAKDPAKMIDPLNQPRSAR